MKKALKIIDRGLTYLIAMIFFFALSITQTF
jgi:hypothetical protein